MHLEDGGTYWDRLFSQNPPVRELLDAGPDEPWVIQINPQQRDTEPTTLAEIADQARSRRPQPSGPNRALWPHRRYLGIMGRRPP